MLNTNNVEIIYDKIMVFRGGLKNSLEIMNKIEELGQWQPWYDVGEQIVFNPEATLIFSEFPTQEQWDKARQEKSSKQEPAMLLDVINTMEEVFYQATNYYFAQYPPQQDNWMHGGSNILKYEGREAKPEEVNNLSIVTNAPDAKYATTSGAAGGTKELTLPFHTDFYQADEFEPGPKAEYTVTVYLNDDYEGGEIDYKVFNGNATDMDILNGTIVPRDKNYGEVPEIMYRPQAGDIIIFPSRVPYYHGVRRVLSGTKRFIRMFWMSQLY